MAVRRLMRIGIVISNYRRWGGLERVSGEWARGLAERGHDVTVFAQTFEPGPGDEPIEFIPVGGLTSPIAARASTFPFAATAAVRRNPRDLIVSFGFGVLDPCVVRLHGAHRPWWEIATAMSPVTSAEGVRRRLNPHHRVILELERRLFGRGRALAVLPAAELAAQDIKRLYPKIAPRVHVLPDGIDLDAFQFSAAGRDELRSAWGADDSYVVLTVATEVRRKGTDTLLRAFAGVARERPDALLIVAGTADAGEIARAAAAAGVANRVRVAGFVPDISSAYSAADLFVFPSIYEHWGLPIVEALACGTPVVASALAGASQAIVDGGTGILIHDPADPAAVAAATLRGMMLGASRSECRQSVEPMAWDRVMDDVDKTLIAIYERTTR